MKTINILIISLFIINTPCFSAENHSENHKLPHETHQTHEMHHGREENEHDKHEGHHGHGSQKAIGEGKAIVEVDEEKGFILSHEAEKTIGVKLTKPESKTFYIPKNALVVSTDKRGVYRLRDKFFKMISAKILKESDKKYLVKIDEFKKGDHFAIDGVGLLRVSDIYSTDKSEYGHAH